jgi:hypothetical protein
MLFLMNDVLLDLDPKLGLPPLELHRFTALSTSYVARLGAEAFAAEPRLQRTNVEKAKRLAALIRVKEPDVNAALFVAPSEHCKPEQVLYRFATLSVDVIAGLQSRQNAGSLNALTADKEVWRRLAA